MTQGEVTESPVAHSAAAATHTLSSHRLAQSVLPAPPHLKTHVQGRQRLELYQIKEPNSFHTRFYFMTFNQYGFVNSFHLLSLLTPHFLYFVY